MLFWVCATALSLAVGAILWRALMMVPAIPDGPRDIVIYRDQLAEIDRDIARGTLLPEDAARLRTEVSRRILAADRAAQAGRGPAPDPSAQPGPDGSNRTANRWADRPSRALLSAALAFGLAGASALYVRIGAPGAPDQPMSGRLAKAEALRRDRPSQALAVADMAAARDASGAARPAPAALSADHVALIDQLRTAVAQHPDSIEGQALLAANEAALGNFGPALAAQSALINLKGTAALPMDFARRAELMISATEGYVSPEAEADLTEALGRDPENGPARYYSGLMMVQTGRPDLAFRLWRGLLEQGPEDAPWIAPIRAAIPDLAWQAGVFDYEPPPAMPPAMPPAAQPASGPAPSGVASSSVASTGSVSSEPTLSGPDSAEVAAAAAMTPEDRRAMIAGMVNGLAARLASTGGPAGDWARLITSYGQLGDTARARAVLTEARQVFGAAPADLAIIDAAAAAAGLAP